MFDVACEGGSDRACFNRAQLEKNNDVAIPLLKRSCGRQASALTQAGMVVQPRTTSILPSSSACTLSHVAGQRKIVVGFVLSS